MKKYQLLSASALLGFSSLVLAHPGHGLESASAGFTHPFMGLDHLLVMLAVGILATSHVAKVNWKLPLAFIVAMAIGFLLSISGCQLAGIETSIAASVMAMGALLLIKLPIHNAVRIGLVAIFAVFHGMAHGVELTTQSGLPVMAGMLLATALLHGLGILAGTFKMRFFQLLQNGLAVCMVFIGGYALIA